MTSLLFLLQANANLNFFLEGNKSLAVVFTKLYRCPVLQPIAVVGSFDKILTVKSCLERNLAVRRHSYVLYVKGYGGFLLSQITSPEKWCSETKLRNIMNRTKEHVDCGAIVGS